jgi:hypothetical protein
MHIRELCVYQIVTSSSLSVTNWTVRGIGCKFATGTDTEGHVLKALEKLLCKHLE